MTLAAKFPFAAAFLGMLDHAENIRGQLFTDDLRRMQRHRARLGIPALGGSLSRTITR